MPRAWTPTDWSTQGPRVLELKQAGKTFKDIGAIIGVHHETVRAWFNKQAKASPAQELTMHIQIDPLPPDPVTVLEGQLSIDDPNTPPEDTVSTLVDIVPVNEAQARPLAGLLPEQQQQVWRQVVESAPPSGITAKHVQQTVKQSKRTTPKTKHQAPQPKQPPRKELQDALTYCFKGIPHAEAWPALASLWIGLEEYDHRIPDITESALAVSVDALRRLLPLFPPSTVEHFKLGQDWHESDEPVPE